MWNKLHPFPSCIAIISCSCRWLSFVVVNCNIFLTLCAALRSVGCCLMLVPSHLRFVLSHNWSDISMVLTIMLLLWIFNVMACLKKTTKQSSATISHKNTHTKRTINLFVNLPSTFKGILTCLNSIFGCIHPVFRCLSENRAKVCVGAIFWHVLGHDVIQNYTCSGGRDIY